MPDKYIRIKSEGLAHFRFLRENKDFSDKRHADSNLIATFLTRRQAQKAIDEALDKLYGFKGCFKIHKHYKYTKTGKSYWMHNFDVVFLSEIYIKNHPKMNLPNIDILRGFLAGRLSRPSYPRFHY